MNRLFSIAAAAAVALTTSAALASNIGTAAGNLNIHYGASPEIPANQTYIEVTGAPFNYNPALTDDASVGYGPNHYFQTLTNSFQFNISFGVNGNSAPDVTAYTKYLNQSPPATSNADWAITDPAGGGFNSALRGGNGDGSSITVTNQLLTQVGTVFHLDIYGSLATDGSVHWVNFAPSALPIPGLSSNIYFHGSFVYDSATDTTPGLDTYTGVMTFDTAAIPVPLPASAWSGLALLGGMGLVVGTKRMRSAQA